MVLKRNLEYWQISLKNPEAAVDEYYIFDEVIIEDKELIRKVERLRELIISYCVMLEKDKKAAGEILNEIYEIIISNDKIQYTEFIAFWKALDMSFSVFKKLPNHKIILAELLETYCLRRRQLYEKLGYSNVTVQALYDSGVSRKKGTAGIIKVLDLASKILGLKENEHLRTIKEVENCNRGYFLPDKEDKKLFESFRERFNIAYQFGKNHQGKKPDIVLKIGDHFFIIEAKHIKESGGAQDKQIVETIEFIKYSENSEFIHYLSFVDGVYFNNFIWTPPENSSKVNRQKEDIEKYLKENPNNFFVNTAGLKEIFEDLSKNKI
ncbi:MAG: hypothetical protein H5T85_05170 [Actinobacteria bacterium]|jgi:hypothetical protein|nr:hypothetical protein [Nitrososphaeria archaeon]MBC7333828.1 hypothetical protein [Actinomycetota bacterium]